MAGLFALALASCSPKASVEGVISGAADKDVVVKLLDMNIYNVLDTVKTDASGHFSYKVDVAEGQPEFVYLFCDDTKVASLLLQKGDKVQLSADMSGSWSVSGSEECEKLCEVEKDYAEFLDKMNTRKDNSVLVKDYVEYYRSRVKYIMSNPYSLTSIPVLYQNVNDNLAVFSQPTDALLFRNTADSLMTVYPESKYVKALDREAARRQQLLSLDNRLAQADVAEYPDFTIPDINGQNVTLSQIDASVVLIYFWTATDANQKMFNIDSMLPLYEDFHDRGLEICAVSLDMDKALWATTVRNQKLPWINLCDGKGSLGQAPMLYNVTAVPSMFVIDHGTLSTVSIDSEASMRRELRRMLK